MEFPAARVAKGEANIAHELGHVYFPNGDRMLAEAVGVYLQDEHGVNPGFPNYREKVHEMMGCRCSPANRAKIDLAGLAQRSTPGKISVQFDGIPAWALEGWAYIVSASFVRYIIETYGLEKFRALYMETPFRPGRRVAGQSGRWSDAYKLSLSDLEKNWKSMIE